MNSLTEEIKETRLSDELFDKNKITEWYMRWDKTTWFSNPKHYKGKIEFQNGDMKGEKKFEAHSFKELVQMMDDFTSNL